MGTPTATKTPQRTAAAKRKAAATTHDARAPNASKEIAPTSATPMDVARGLVDRLGEMGLSAGWSTLTPSQRQAVSRFVKRTMPRLG